MAEHGVSSVSLVFIFEAAIMRLNDVLLLTSSVAVGTTLPQESAIRQTLTISTQFTDLSFHLAKLRRVAASHVKRRKTCELSLQTSRPVKCVTFVL